MIKTPFQLACVLSAFVALSGCSEKPALVAPRTLTAPYDTTRGEALWAVIPLRNETGTSAADPLLVTDAVVAAAEQAQGVRCVPLNRTIEAMRALKLEAIRTPGEARLLAQKMGVDGIVAGSITAYDPYTPALGIALALYARPGPMEGQNKAPLDPRKLTASANDGGPPAVSQFADAPVAVVSEFLDAKNQQVLMDLRTFAVGRSDPEGPLGWKRYTKSMPLFTEFAAYHAMDRLLESEWTRLARRAVTKQAGGRAAAHGDGGRMTPEEGMGRKGN